MSAHVLDFPRELSTAAARRAQIARSGVQLDFATLLGKLERSLRWLDRHQIEVVAFAASTLKGARVHVRGGGKLRGLLAEELWSAGHQSLGGVRFEQWQARDPVTGVLILWEEEVQA